ncbi:MAG: hypothetical protein FWD98_06920 [Defluviitaleaceae bacterium]|nr:hypothetical protein [Defluviitaleaceae bacterium]
MGMTDHQFDTYQKSLLRELKRIKASADEQGAKIAELDELIADTEQQLQRS